MLAVFITWYFFDGLSLLVNRQERTNPKLLVLKHLKINWLENFDEKKTKTRLNSCSAFFQVAKTIIMKMRKICVRQLRDMVDVLNKELSKKYRKVLVSDTFLKKPLKVSNEKIALGIRDLRNSFATNQE